MRTNIEIIKNNGFKLIRKSTKHQKNFITNYFERPMTHYELFRLLSESEIEKTMYDCALLMLEKYVTNYYEKQISTVKIQITKTTACIIFTRTLGRENIYLNREKVIRTLCFFNNQEIYSTDYKL
jgi:Fe-S-cluster containining protein